MKVGDIIYSDLSRYWGVIIAARPHGFEVWWFGYDFDGWRNEDVRKNYYSLDNLERAGFKVMTGA